MSYFCYYYNVTTLRFYEDWFFFSANNNDILLRIRFFNDNGKRCCSKNYIQFDGRDDILTKYPKYKVSI